MAQASWRSRLARWAVYLAVPILAYRIGSSPQWQATLGSSAAADFPQLIDASTETIIKGLEAGDFSSVELVQAYFKRIEEVNSTLRAVVELNPDALAIASALDQERTDGKTRGPLHGIPYLIKNNIATDDEMETSGGSHALLGAKVQKDATVVSKLRAAGVIILGKTNLSQWANWRSTNGTSSSGWSAVGGQVIGPFHSHQDPCGSSSGSGVAATLGLSVAAVGTETDGSILCPSGANNIVGIKPTVGLTSRHLVIPISQRQDTVGPMARTVKDAAYLLQAIAGRDPNDNYTSAMPFDELPDYVDHCKFDGLRGARIGIPRNMIIGAANNSAVLSAFERAIHIIQAAGAIMSDGTNITEAAVSDLIDPASYVKLLTSDFLSNLPGLYLSQLKTNPNKIESVEDLRSFTRDHPFESFPDRNTGRWDYALEQAFENTDSRFWSLYERSLRIGGRDGILGALEKFNLDALIVPTEDASSLAARVGAPVITVPLGHYPRHQEIKIFSRNLVEAGPNIPFGLSFIGAKWSEAKLISYAYAFEQRTHTRLKVHPQVYPRSELRDIVRRKK